MNDTVLPNWAPRVTRKQIFRFYTTIGQGLIDEEVINDLGVSLLARCQSVLDATEARRGRALCPGCGDIVVRTPCEDEVLACQKCGWTCLWSVYMKTFQGKHLFVGGAEPFFKEFVQEYTRNKTIQQRLLLIDTLIHRWHYEWTDKPCGAAAANLIEGKPSATIAFLDQLTYGDQIPPEVQAMRTTWRSNWERSRRVWNVEYRKQLGIHE